MKMLILGGVKSGKSRYAEQQAAAFAREQQTGVTVIATAEPLDAEMQQRIRRHQADRPAHWQTIEAPVHLAAAIRQAPADHVIVVDCLTLWLTNLMLQEQESVDAEQGLLLEVLASRKAPVLLVSNETSMGVIPMGELSRRFCDLAGLLNQKLAGLCDHVVLIVAGLPLPLKQSAKPH